jgi:hypothetical protein
VETCPATSGDIVAASRDMAINEGMVKTVSILHGKEKVYGSIP